MDQHRITKEEVLDAFRKLQSQIYFDNNNLYLRNDLANYKELHKDDLEEHLYSIADQINAGSFRVFSENINLVIMPKDIRAATKRKFSSNYYSNSELYNGSEITRLGIHCRLSIDLHVICVLWLIKYGVVLENGIIDSSCGNRLSITKGDLNKGRTLYKPYQMEYQKWWRDSVEATQDLIRKGDNATIVNFDLKDFFHRATINFKNLTEYIEENKKGTDSSKLHKVFGRIHFEYKKKLYETDFDGLKEGTKANEFPLPITVVSSHVLANWYMRSLDQYINNELKPIYYGRYVDDVLLVFKNTVLNKDHFEKSSIKHSEKRKDCEEQDLVNANLIYLNTYLNKLFDKVITEDDNIKFVSDDNEILAAYQNLILQKEKLFVYQFNSELTPAVIQKFVQEQKERSSEFRFLSDQADNYFDDFETTVFESSFEMLDVNKAKFKNVEDNKFKLSVFLSKLIRKKITNGENYKLEEIGKVSKYFKGYFGLKHYYFWDKILTLFVVYRRGDLLLKFLEDLHTEIKACDLTEEAKQSIKIPDDIFGIAHTKFFYEHLKASISLSIGLDPTVLFNAEHKLGLNQLDASSKDVLTQFLGSMFEIDVKKANSTDLYDSVMKMRWFCLLRKEFCAQPLIQLQPGFIKSDLPFYDIKIWRSEEIVDFFSKDNDLSEHGFANHVPLSISVPYRIKFYEVVIYLVFKTLRQDTVELSSLHTQWWNDIIPSFEILDQAFEVYWEMNYKYSEDNNLFQANLKQSIFDQVFENGKESRQNCTEIRKPEERTHNYHINQIKVGKTKALNSNPKIGIVNTYVNSKNFTKSLLNKPNLETDRIQDFFKILDVISETKKCDLFVQPELSLPHELIYHYCGHCSSKDVGFVTGVEHIREKNVVYNFILTFLPVRIKGFEQDGVPIFRLKNHYAPAEEELIRDNRLIVPKPNPYRYDLFIWRGMNFSSYYCFELADVFHRTALFGKVDFLVAPIWNQDMPYYNSIVDSTTRDLHCFIVQVNTSQYGDSRIARPTDSVRKDKARVTGGTTNSHSFNVLISELDINGLREFQKLSFNGQKELNKTKKSFKPTPPDYPIKDVFKRENGMFFRSKLDSNQVINDHENTEEELDADLPF